MRLVETVFGELGAGVEDRVGGRLGDSVADRAGDETFALGVHLGLDLLAHRAAQDVGLSQTVARQVFGDLLDLLLIGDDAERLLEDRLQQRMRVFDLLFAELARAIDGDIGHRARTIERDQSDQVLEAVGPHVDQRLLHPRAFDLEHADRFAASEHLERLLVVKRNG